MGTSWGFILNPIAGGGYGESIIKKLEEKIAEYMPDAELAVTERPGHATDIAGDFLKRGINRLIAVGGDGTVHEIARTIVGNPEAALGVVPAGTGNDFIQIPGFPDRFEEKDWDTLFKNRTAAIDVGTCNEDYFFNGMGMGYDAQMTADLTAYRKRTGNMSNNLYTFFIIKTLLGYKEKLMRTTIGERESTERRFLTTCSIGRRYAAKYYMTPRAIADDGLLDVMRIEPIPLHLRIKLLTQVPSGAHINHPKVDYQKVSSLTIEFEEPTPAHLDGELIFAKKFKIALIPGALNIIYNPAGNHFLGRV